MQMTINVRFMLAVSATDARLAGCAGEGRFLLLPPFLIETFPASVCAGLPQTEKPIIPTEGAGLRKSGFPVIGAWKFMKRLFGLIPASGLVFTFTLMLSQRAWAGDGSLAVTDAPPGNPGTLPQLNEALSLNLHNLAVAPGKTWNYVPGATGLGTNTAVWTWPVNLSCVGIASDYYQATLIAPDKLLTCSHYGGEAGKTVQFHDTNGIPWTAHVTNTVKVAGDLCISFLGEPAPPSILIPAILPPDATDYRPTHSLVGLPAFWVHRNGTNSSVGGTIQYDPVVLVANLNGTGGFGTWMRVRHDGFGPYGNGTSASGGDSGSPVFMVFSNTPVLLFATTASGDAAGLFVSGDQNFPALAAGGYTNGMKILDLRGFEKFP